ncbi:MAG: DUF1840 domain-containing protein [Betaproteobacteria bacterium]|nr:DUF1840 domain-containing protein [Betaproteobacteria bacterium]
MRSRAKAAVRPLAASIWPTVTVTLSSSTRAPVICMISRCSPSATLRLSSAGLSGKSTLKPGGLTWISRQLSLGVHPGKTTTMTITMKRASKQRPPVSNRGYDVIGFPASCLILKHVTRRTQRMPLLFESRASGSVLMTDASASALLQALGRSESDGSVAPEGVFSVEQLPDLIAKLQALIDQSKKQQQQQQQVESRPGGNDDREQQPASIAMHQRAWPLLEQCRRALAAEKAVTWRRPS